MKRVSISLLLLAASCGQPDTADQAARAGPQTSGRLVDCAIGGSDRFEHVCTIDRRPRPDGQILTIRAPDGGFRRLLVRSDGSGIAAADGAEAVRVGKTQGGVIEIAIGGDRYRLPAKS